MRSFRKSYEEIEKQFARIKQTTISGVSLVGFWETQKDILEKVIPPPLKPAQIPVVMALIARFDATSAGVAYNETSLMARVSYKGESVNYILGMHVTDDRSAFAGREFLGFPKKLANIELHVKDNEVRGWGERLGTRCIDIKSSLDGQFNEEDALEMFEKAGFFPEAGKPNITFLFKHFFNSERINFAHNPVLIKQPTDITVKTFKMGRADIKLNSSDHDPWGEIEVLRPLGAIFTENDVIMHPGKRLCEVDGKTFLPYAFNKWDWY